MYLNNLFRSTSIKQIARLHLYVCVVIFRIHLPVRAS